ncbi:MAG: tetratricopeptide repeat protein [Bacteroidota bacterium]
MQEEDLIETIERYLNGEMSPGEKEDFEQKLEMDPLLKDELEVHQQAVNSLQDYEGLKDEMRGIYDRVKENGRKKKTANRIMKYAVAASVAMIIAATSLFVATNKETKEQKLFASYYVPFYQDGVFRNDHAMEVDSLLSQATHLYGKGDYEQAARLFDGFIASGKDDELAAIYLGNCYLQLGDVDKARAVLKEARKTTNNRMAQYAKWYLALTELRSENSPEAVAILEEIRSGGGIYEREADSLLRELR